jgi:PspAB-like protein
MAFFDALLGRRKTKGPAPDRLFAITTAYVTLEAQHSITTQGAAAIVFQPLATGDFQQIVADVEETVRGTSQETGTSVETHDDEFDYRWVILRDPDLEDLAVGVNAVSDALAIGGYKDRVLCAVFAFKDATSKPLYFIYNYKRGSWYPFVPAPGDKQRSTERELQMKALVGPELPIEPEAERWFPLWGIPI